MHTASNTPKIAIIVLNWNGKRDTKDCLESLEKLTYPSYEIIVVDNGSTDGSVPYLRDRFPGLLIIKTGANLGFAEGNNVGIRKALKQGADLFFLLNNDTIVASDILERFVDTYRSNPQAGILGARIYLHEQRDTLDHLGGLWNSKTGTFDFIGHRLKDEGAQEPQELDYVCGAGLIVKRAVIESIGFLEPKFFLIWEESDFCLRAKRTGYKILTCPQAILWHKVSASFVGGKIHSTYFWWRNRLLWIERNCPRKEKWSLYLKVLIPDILHMLKIRLLKQTQLFFSKIFAPTHDYREKEQKMLMNRAALSGVRDYFLRRFGNAPQWVYKTKKDKAAEKK
jgi:GT2 family glycosyltransferase